jgi:aminopeptidase-like protein
MFSGRHGKRRSPYLVSRVHPSLANDNLSGIAVATFLARELRRRALRYSYRFLSIPGTIGAITWLAQNQSRIERIKHGLVLTCVGDPGAFHYKKSRRGNATIDRAMALVLRRQSSDYEIRRKLPRQSDSSIGDFSAD